MGCLAIFGSYAEKVAPECEFVNVGTKFERETKERRKGRRGRGACPSQQARWRCRDAAGRLRMGSLIHQRLSSEVDTL